MGLLKIEILHAKPTNNIIKSFVTVLVKLMPPPQSQNPLTHHTFFFGKLTLGSKKFFPSLKGISLTNTINNYFHFHSVLLRKPHIANVVDLTRHKFAVFHNFQVKTLTQQCSRSRLIFRFGQMQDSCHCRCRICTCMPFCF